MRRRLVAHAVATALLSSALAFTVEGSAQAVTSGGAEGGTYGQAVCGTRDGVTGGQAVSVPPAKALTPRTSLAGFVAVANTIYEMDGAARRISSFTSTGTQLNSYPVSTGPFTIDPSGASYTVDSNYTLVKRSSDGTELWRSVMPAPIVSLAGAPGQTWQLVVLMRDRTNLADPATGELWGSSTVSGSSFGGTAASGLLSTDGHYVRAYDSSLSETKRFGSSADANLTMPDGAPLHFHVPGGAAQLADGRYLVTDSGNGIWLLDADGIPLGLAPQSGTGTIPQGSSVAIIDDNVLYSMGAPFSSNQTIGSMPLADLLALATSAPPSTGPRLGFGAGLDSGVPGNYFAPGVAPRMRTLFDPAWKRLSGLTLTYRVRDSFQVMSQASVPAQTLAITSDVIDRGADLSLPPVAPGAYEIDSHLARNGVEISSTCVHYTVGAAGNTLDLANLPGKADAGGPDGPRGVALTDVFGLGAHRLALDWRRLLDANGNTDFSHYDPEIQAAATEARNRHVLLSVQLGSGGPERAFVDSGTWGARVQQVIAHWAPLVDYWEAWNEPNITYGSGTDYVNKILHPFSDAVLAADPTAKRLGGTVVSIGSVEYWKAIVAAGGADFMDIAAIHPYPGHNRSFEEEGFATKVQQIRDAFVAGGKSDMPIWITEFAHWSDGPGNYFAQADKTVRDKIISASLGIDNWEYFLAQGTWGNDGVTFSAIQGDAVVKPVAAALMVSRTQLHGRPFLGWVNTAGPHTLIARYGAPSGGSGSMLAAWSDDASVPVALGGPQGTLTSITDEYGRRQSIQLGATPTALTLTGSVQYIPEPAGTTLTVVPTEEWAANVALASNGSIASASSRGNWNLADKAIDGIGSALGQGDFRSSSAWASAPGDSTPALTVTFKAPTSIDRVVWSTGGLGSVQPGIRDADIAVQDKDGSWITVGKVRNVFALRTTTVAFPPTTAAAIRLTVLSVNLSGYNGGATPWFWPTDAPTLGDATQPWYGPAIVRELEAYSPGAVMATMEPTPPPPPPASTALQSQGSVTGVAGRAINRAATLVDRNGTGIAGKSVSLRVRPRGGTVWNVAARKATNSTGGVTFTLTPSASTDVSFSFDGDPRFAGSESRASTVIVSRAVSLKASSPVVKKGGSVRVQGGVSPKATGYVYLQRYVNGKWQNVARLGLAASAYSYNLRLTAAGKYVLRTYRNRDAATEAGSSSTLTLRAS